MQQVTDYIVTVDHAYGGERERTFKTREAADQYAAEQAQLPYVNRVHVDEMTFQIIDGVMVLS